MQQKSSREPKDTLKNLPIYRKRQEIIDQIKQNKFTIIVGGTGCGKSTQISQYLLKEYYEQDENAKILWDLPRKISTSSLVERVSQEMDMTLGDIDSILVRELTKIRENLNPSDKRNSFEQDFSFNYRRKDYCKKWGGNLMENKYVVRKRLFPKERIRLYRF